MINEKAPDLNELARTHGTAAVHMAFNRAARNTLETDAGGPPAQNASLAPSIDGRQLVMTTAADIEPETREWVWKGRLALGEHTMLAGEPGTGKSQLSIAIVAAVTTGGLWPCGEGQAPLGSVVILSAEDNIKKTVVPRLMAAGADRKRVHIVEGTRDTKKGRNQSFNLQIDLDLLERMIADIGDVRLVYIDPVSAYMGGSIDSHKNTQVRAVLQPVGELAQRMNIAVLSVTHFSKGGSGVKALHRVIDSIAFTAAPRAVFMVTPDPDDPDRKLLLFLKSNIDAPAQGLAYRIEPCVIDEVKNISASRVTWDSQPVLMSADEAIATGSEDRNLLDEALDFLREELRNGEVGADEMKKRAEDAGIAPRTFKRARAKLGVVSRREGFGAGSKSLLSLPDHHTEPKPE
jgi:putative DNA primase/helicase